MSIEMHSLLLFGALLLAVMLGVPLVFAMGGVGVIMTYFLWGPGAVYSIASHTFNSGTNFILLAIPLFIFMGAMLEKSGIAKALYDTMYQWLGRLKGGLAMGTVGICAVIAAMVGISGAATVSVGQVALPSMFAKKYDKQIALGCVSAGGALGILIPPSAIMILIGLFANLSVGKLFLGGILPGILLAMLFIIYIGIRSHFQQHLGPPVPAEERLTLPERVVMLRSLALPILLVIGVMGSIFIGAATPTEAAAVGVVGSLLCALVNGKLSRANLLDACQSSLRLSAMVMWIIFAASMFTALYTAMEAHTLVEKLLSNMPGGRWGVLIGMQLILFVLGCLLDPAGIVMITIPLFVPLIVKLGFDPLWFGILFVVNMEMAYLTPPVGFNLFYVRAIAPKHVKMADIYRSVLPFVALQALGLAFCMAFPEVVLWLPNLLIQ